MMLCLRWLQFKQMEWTRKHDCCLINNALKSEIANEQQLLNHTLRKSMSQAFALVSGRDGLMKAKNNTVRMDTALLKALLKELIRTWHTTVSVFHVMVLLLFGTIHFLTFTANL